LLNWYIAIIGIIFSILVFGGIYLYIEIMYPLSR